MTYQLFIDNLIRSGLINKPILKTVNNCKDFKLIDMKVRKHDFPLLQNNKSRCLHSSYVIHLFYFSRNRRHIQNFRVSIWKICSRIKLIRYEYLQKVWFDHFKICYFLYKVTLNRPVLSRNRLSPTILIWTMIESVPRSTLIHCLYSSAAAVVEPHGIDRSPSTAPDPSSNFPSLSK